MSQKNLQSQVSEDATVDSLHGQQACQRRGQPSVNSQNEATGQGNQRSGQTKFNKKKAPDTRSVDSGYSESSCTSQGSEYSLPNSEHSSRYESGRRLSNTPSRSCASDVMSPVSQNVQNIVNNKFDSLSLSPSSNRSSHHPQNEHSFIPESYTDEEVEEYLWQMPYDLKEDYQDGMILYSEDDRNEVKEFLSSLLENVVLSDKKPPMVILSDEIATSVSSRLKTLDFGLQRCNYIFLFLTKNFVKDSWAEFSGETCLMEAIQNPEKRWCVVPVFTQPKRNCSFPIPPSINSLKGVQYWSGSRDKFYNDSVKKLLDDKLNVRKVNQEGLRKKRRNWFREFKHRESVKKIQEAYEEKQKKDELEKEMQEAQSKCSAMHSMSYVTEPQQKVSLHFSHSMPQDTDKNNSLIMAKNFQHGIQTNPNSSSFYPVSETQQPSKQLQKIVLPGSNFPTMSGGMLGQYVSLDSNVVPDAEAQSINTSNHQDLRFDGLSLQTMPVNPNMPQECVTSARQIVGGYPNMPQNMTGNLPEQERIIPAREIVGGYPNMTGKLPEQERMTPASMTVSGYPNMPLNMTGNLPEQGFMTPDRNTVGSYPYMPQNMTGNLPEQGLMTPARATVSGYSNMPQNMTGNLPVQKHMTLNEVEGYLPNVPQGQSGNRVMQPNHNVQNYASFPRTTSTDEYMSKQVPPEMMHQMDKGMTWQDTGLMSPGETVDRMHGIGSDVKHVHYHTHYYQTTPELQRPLNIINPKVVQIGQSNIVSGTVNSEEDSIADETEPESSLVEESDRGIYSNIVRPIPDMHVPYPPDQFGDSRMSQDNLPSESVSGRRQEAMYARNQDQARMHSTQLKSVDEPLRQPSGKRQQHQKPFTTMGLKDSDSSLLYTMQNPPLHAMPRLGQRASPIRNTAVVNLIQSGGGTSPVQNVGRPNPIQNSSLQNVAKPKPMLNVVTDHSGKKASNPDPVDNQQTATKSVVWSGIESTMRDVVQEQTLKKSLDNPYETELQLPDDDPNDPHNQTLVKQYHVSPASAFTSTNRDNETMNNSLPSVSTPFGTTCQTDPMGCNMSGTVELSSSGPGTGLDLPIPQSTEKERSSDECTCSTVIDDCHPCLIHLNSPQVNVTVECDHRYYSSSVDPVSCGGRNDIASQDTSNGFDKTKMSSTFVLQQNSVSKVISKNADEPIDSRCMMM